MTGETILGNRRLLLLFGAVSIALFALLVLERNESDTLRAANRRATKHLIDAAKIKAPAATDAPRPHTPIPHSETMKSHPGWANYTSQGLFDAVAESDMFASAQCIGNSDKHKKDPQGWKKTTCRFKNLCYLPETKEFVYHKRPGDSFNEVVSIGAVNEQWSEQDKNRMRWQPRIVDGPLPKGSVYRTHQEDEVFIPHFEHCAANVMHLIMDSFYPWHNAVELFQVQKHIMPLRVRVGVNLWGTCDYVQQERDRGEAWAQHHFNFCPRNTQRWLPAMLPAVNGVYQTEITNTSSFAMDNPSKMVCFKDAIVGVGVLSDHCLKSHGWSWDRKDISDFDCNQNRGPLAWSFRQRMIAVSGARTLRPEKHTILLFSFGSRGGPRWGTIRQHLKQLFPDAVVEDARLGPARSQLEQIQRATVVIAAMGGNTITSLFLPRGAGLILMHDGKDRLDWDFWTHLPHLALEWASSAELTQKNTLGAIVKRRMTGYEEFGSGFATAGGAASPQAAVRANGTLETRPPVNATAAAVLRPQDASTPKPTEAAAATNTTS